MSGPGVFILQWGEGRGLDTVCDKSLPIEDMNGPECADGRWKGL
jgi:hypothetical protein